MPNIPSKFVQLAQSRGIETTLLNTEVLNLGMQSKLLGKVSIKLV
jgi:hypothetical protein